MLYHFGTKGPAAEWLDGLDWLLSYPLYVLPPLYSWLVLRAYRRYTRYLDDNFSDAERLRFAGLRQLLVLQVLSWTLSLLFKLTDITFGFSYDEPGITLPCAGCSKVSSGRVCKPTTPPLPPRCASSPTG